jgi:DNA-binding PadR family transcriptional regulator
MARQLRQVGVGRGAARVYSLTRKGRRGLVERRRDWASFAAAVRGVVGA